MMFSRKRRGESGKRGKREETTPDRGKVEGEAQTIVDADSVDAEAEADLETDRAAHHATDRANDQAADCTTDLIAANQNENAKKEKTPKNNKAAKKDQNS